jgi:protease-4
VNIKVLFQALNKPWYIERNQAKVYAKILQQTLAGDFKMGAGDDTDDGSFQEDVNCVITQDDIATVKIISIIGPLMKYDTCMSRGMLSIQAAIEQANNNDSVLSIVLAIDSPGGTVDGTDNLAKAIKNSKKPVVTYVNGMMCSAAYWIGSSAAYIVCDNANDGYQATIGSIGTMMVWEDDRKADEMEGIEEHIILATKSTKKIARLEAFQKGDFSRAIMDLDNLNNTFLNAVSANRTGKLNDKLPGILEGEVFNGNDALTVGLIDSFGDLKFAINKSISLAKTIKK